jgi:hypothetical protein
VRLGFGRVLERVLVDPRFHRLHHMRVDPERPRLHDCNYGQVLSLWDVLFGTALYGEPARPTGVGDPMVDADNGRGLVAMQWGALRRFWGAVRTPAGWRPGDVAFGADHVPVPTTHADLHRFAPTVASIGPTGGAAPRDVAAAESAYDGRRQHAAGEAVAPPGVA